MFEIPDAKKSIGQNVFDVKLPNGKVYKLPKFEYLTPRQAAQFDTVDEDIEATYNLLDDIAKPKGLGSFLMDSPVLYTNQLMDAWVKDSGATPGESGNSEG